MALLTRYIGLTNPTSDGTPVFDEKHYVPQAFDVVSDWQNFIIGGIESNPGYGLVVHPPLGKQLLSWGEQLFGYTPLGWRVVVAAFGCLTVLATMELARRLSYSWFVAFIAGIFACMDGVLLVTSKFGMLDIFQVFFVVLTALLLTRDHEQVRARLHRAWENGQMGTSEYGPRFGFRWWRFAAGVSLGLALSVKWSGLYYIAFFGLMSVFSDLALRKRYGVKRYVTGTLVRDTIPALASIVVVAVAIYVWSWRAWFANETSVYRHAATDGTIDPNSWLSLLPAPIASWLYYHQSVLEFHSSLTSSGGHSHPWDSKPFSWLVAGRPVLYLSATDLHCGGTTCRSMIFLFGTPPIWWLTVPIVFFALYRLILRRDRRFLVPLVAFGAGFIPWVMVYDRQMYFFYATSLVPFTIVMLAMAVGMLIGRGHLLPWTKILTPSGVTSGTFAAIVYVALVIAGFFFWMPILYGIVIPNSYYDQLMWLPSWT